jgi:antitoxin Phd
MEWQFAEATQRFRDVMAKALTEGPQRVRRGEDVVVVLAEADYLRLISENQSLGQYLLEGPDLSGLDFSRDDSPMREVEW